MLSAQPFTYRDRASDGDTRRMSGVDPWFGCRSATHPDAAMMLYLMQDSCRRMFELCECFIACSVTVR